VLSSVLFSGILIVLIVFDLADLTSF